MQLIKLTIALFLLAILSGCATYVKSGSDTDEVRLFRNGFMTTYDTFLRAAEHCLESQKLAVMTKESVYGEYEGVLGTPTEVYKCVEL